MKIDFNFSKLFDTGFSDLFAETIRPSSAPVNFKKIDGFIEFATKHSDSTSKIKTLNDNLRINDEILHIMQAYDSKEIKNFSKKKKCRTIVHDINSEYNAIKKELGYK